jgi:hypothetical protein
LDGITGKTELIGVVAVVLSLMFVGYEIRQNTNISAAQAVFDLNEAGRQNLLLRVSDPEVTALVLAAENDPESMTELKQDQFRSWVFSFLNLYESAWNHHQRGVIGDEDLEGFKIDYCIKVAIDAYRNEMATIRAHSSEFRDELSRWCDE